MSEETTDKITADEETLQLLAKHTGTDIEVLRNKNVQVDTDFVSKLKAGEIVFSPRAATPAEAQGVDQVIPARPQGLERPKYTPQEIIESRYASILRQADAMSATQPISTEHRPADPTNAAAPLEATAHIPNDKRPVKTVFMEFHKKLKVRTLSIRPPGSPSILQECRGPIKLFISQHQSPGDILMLTRAVADLHRTYPGKFITCMRTPAAELWEHNPHHTPIPHDDADAMWLSGEYKLVNTSNRGAHHFVHGFRRDMEAKLGLPIEQSHPWGLIRLGDKEKTWYSQIHEILGKNVPFWIVDAGRKSDYTAKHWEVSRFQEMVDRTPDITWVQVGADRKDHYHPELKGTNVINLIGKTSIRQLVRLVYHSAGVVTPVSFPMHLAAAVPVHPRYKRRSSCGGTSEGDNRACCCCGETSCKGGACNSCAGIRPCITIAGGREPVMWEAYSTHQYLHTCGALPCCAHGGCWKSRVEPLGDGDEKDTKNLCEWVVQGESGQLIPKCMDLITVDQVVSAIRMYQLSYDFSAEDDAKWTAKWPPNKPPALLARIEEVRAQTERGEIKPGSGDPASAREPEQEVTKDEEIKASPENTHAPEETQVTEGIPEGHGGAPDTNGPANDPDAVNEEPTGDGDSAEQSVATTTEDHGEDN